MDSSTVEIIVSVVAGLLLVVGVLGTIFPILPGSMLIIGSFFSVRKDPGIGYWATKADCHWHPELNNGKGIWWMHQ